MLDHNELADLGLSNIRPLREIDIKRDRIIYSNRKLESGINKFDKNSAFSIINMIGYKSNSKSRVLLHHNLTGRSITLPVRQLKSDFYIAIIDPYITNPFL